MKIPSLLQVERLYNQQTTLYLVKFSNQKLASLNRNIAELFRIVGDQSELSIWPRVITTLKKVRFDLATLPVSPEHVITDQLIEQLNTELPVCKISFPDNFEHLSKIISKLQDFKGQNNQFLSWILANYMKKNEKEGLCIHSSRHIKLIEGIISTDKKIFSRNLKVIAPKELKDFTFFNRIFLCGSISLFAENQFRNLEYVWRSPRAPELYFLSYDWIRDNFEPEPSFDVEPNKVAVSIVEQLANTDAVRVVKQSFADTKIFGETDLLESDTNKIDIKEIDFSPAELISPGSPSSAGYFELICESRLLVLENGTVIYKEVDRSSRTVELNEHVEIHMIANQKLEPGMYLVVRTEGSGDSIAAVADLLFGKKAKQIRSMQEQWKVAFRKKLNSYGSICQVAKIMTALGAPTANETNVRNWQRHDTIKPKNENDFKAIMVFSELPDMVDEYWENAKKIFQMHIKAGKEISKLLLSRINDSSMNDLEKYGKIDIKIKGLAGKVSVIGIESIMPDIYNVPSNQLDKVINIEKEL